MIEENKFNVEIVNSSGKAIEISKTRSVDFYLFGRYIGTYQPALWFPSGYEGKPQFLNEKDKNICRS